MTEPRVYKLWECPECGLTETRAGECLGPIHSAKAMRLVELVPKEDYDKLLNKWRAAVPYIEHWYYNNTGRWLEPGAHPLRPDEEEYRLRPFTVERLKRGRKKSA